MIAWWDSINHKSSKPLSSNSIRSDGKDGKAALMSCPEEVNLSTMTLMKKYAVCVKFLEGKWAIDWTIIMKQVFWPIHLCSLKLPVEGSHLSLWRLFWYFFVLYPVNVCCEFIKDSQTSPSHVLTQVPFCTWSLKSFILSRTFQTCRTTFLPSQEICSYHGAHRATCKLAWPSVLLICSHNKNSYMSNYGQTPVPKYHRLYNKAKGAYGYIE